jgi:hypothetical protein
MKTILSLTLVMVGALPACSSESAESAAPSPVVGAWTQTTAEERFGAADWAVAKDAACRTDNTEEYAANGDFTLYDGTIRCGIGGTGISKGTWRLAAANTKLIFTYAGTSGDYVSTVESLTATDMVLTFATGETNGRQTRSTYRKR